MTKEMKGYLKKKTTKVVEVQGAKITVKALSFGDSRKALTAATKMDFVTKSADIDSGLMATLRVLYSIVDWDLVDEEDNKLPITLETFDELLDEDFVGEVLQEVQKASAKDNAVTLAEKK